MDATSTHAERISRQTALVQRMIQRLDVNVPQVVSADNGITVRAVVVAGGLAASMPCAANGSTARLATPARVVSARTRRPPRPSGINIFVAAAADGLGFPCRAAHNETKVSASVARGPG